MTYQPPDPMGPGAPAPEVEIPPHTEPFGEPGSPEYDPQPPAPGYDPEDEPEPDREWPAPDALRAA